MDTSTVLMSLIPIINTVMLLGQGANFSWGTSIPYLLPMLIPLITLAPSWKRIVDFIRHHCQWKKQSPFTFTSRLNLSLWYRVPNTLIRSFSVVLWEWNRQGKTANCTHLMEEGVHHYQYEDTLQDLTPPFFMDDELQRFWNVDRPGIQYSMWVNRLQNNDGTVQSEIFLRIEITEEGANPNTLVQHIDYITSEAKRILAEQARVQRVLVSSAAPGGGGEEKSKGVALMPYEFNTTSSFDNFFCEEADTVRNDLRHFLENKASYSQTGRPWTYTVLNEGPPGVGKTKLVKAVAALTGYTLIVINLSHIKNSQMLYEVFHTTTLAGETVPHDKRLYYIPEVDTQIADFMKTRTAAAVTPLKEGPVTATAAAATTIVTAAGDDSRPTLGEILNILDGVPERYGHILILDTNHLSKLDPALVRPGRVDRILSWKKLSAASVRRFLANYYGCIVPPEIVVPDRHYTAAELQAAVQSCLLLADFVEADRVRMSV